MTECLTTQLPFRLVGGISTGSVYALIAIGYTLVYGVLQLINFAHSEVFMAGVLAGALFFTATIADGATSQGQGLLFIGLALLPAMFASGLLAVGIERVAYKPLRSRGAPRLAYLISAIGASLFLQYLVQVWRGVNPESYPTTLRAQVVFEIGNARIFNRDILVFVVAVVMVVGLEGFVRRTRTGRALRAVAQDAEAASLMGVNIDRIIMITFFIGGILAGAAGLLFGVSFGRTQWNIGFFPGIKAFTAAVLGGIGSIRGALLGGLLLGLIENVSAGCFGSQWRDVFAFVVLVAVLMVRPTGIFGEKT
jgi:branched-chain amino acid transport system permease protein